MPDKGASDEGKPLNVSGKVFSNSQVPCQKKTLRLKQWLQGGHNERPPALTGLTPSIDRGMFLAQPWF
jgi:hypothetical protein